MRTFTPMLGRASLVALLSVVPLGGCGVGSRGGDGLESPRAVVEGARNRRCSFVQEAAEVPGFDDLMRVGTRGSLSLWGRGTEPGDTVELSIRYDDEGRLAWVQTLRSTMPETRVVEVERLLRAAIGEEGPEDWGVRIRLVAGRVDAVLPSVICEPARAPSGPARAPPPLGTGREMAELYAALGRPFTVQVALDAKGRVVDVRVSHSSGSRLLDQHAIDLARSARYDPKLHDGIGVPSVLSISVDTHRRWM